MVPLRFSFNPVTCLLRNYINKVQTYMNFFHFDKNIISKVENLTPKHQHIYLTCIDDS